MTMYVVFIGVAIVVGGVVLLAVLAGDSDRRRPKIQ